MSKKQSWVVRMKCEVLKDVIVYCTEEQARESPWEYAQSEEEVDQRDYEVIEVKSNE